MTSSLVGSEMCIRDSCCREGIVGGGVEAGYASCMEGGGLQEGKVESIETCLLYTSDAADDM
eukprot:12249329-Prorocentrum_lima.AAC.1